VIVVLAVLLIAVPVAFNVFFVALAAVFEYPNILRKSTAEVLTKFRAGGSRLVLLWWGFAMSAALFVPVVVLLSSQLTGADPVLVQVATVVGVLAAVVQFLGLVRWPFMVPQLARESETASPARAEAIDVEPSTGISVWPWGSTSVTSSRARGACLWASRFLSQLCCPAGSVSPVS
jgi:hypothetical protein